MSTVSEKKEPEVLVSATAATTKRTKVRLNELQIDLDRYCHRDPQELTPEKLGPLMASIAVEGLQVPVEYYLDEQGRKVPTKGHRRLSACRILADRNQPGFT